MELICLALDKWPTGLPGHACLCGEWMVPPLQGEGCLSILSIELKWSLLFSVAPIFPCLCLAEFLESSLSLNLLYGAVTFSSVPCAVPAGCLREDQW